MPEDRRAYDPFAPHQQVDSAKLAAKVKKVKEPEPIPDGMETEVEKKETEDA
jgi:hypothetical protein